MGKMRLKTNEKIREAMDRNNMAIVDLANLVGVSDKTMFRWLREEMSPATQERYVAVIEGRARPETLRPNANLRIFIKDNNISMEFLCYRLHMKTPAAVYRWLDGFMTPYEERRWIALLKGEQG